MTNASIINLTTITTIINITSSPDDETDWSVFYKIDWSKTIKAYESSMTYTGIVIAISFLIMLLNAIEIYLIIKKWKTITQFEIILLNLAFSDILVGIVYLILMCVEIYEQIMKTTDYKLYTAIFDFGIFSIFTSGLFVVVIGIERLSAVRTPLKHRMRDTGKKRMFAYMAIVWFLTITITLSVALSDHFIHKGNIYVTVGSRNLAITLATFLFIFPVAILIIYSLIAYFILKRNSGFLTYDKEDSVNQSMIIESIKKEKATILACLLVMVSYLVCNVPFAARLCRIEIAKAETAIMNCNSLLNPLVYFFKGYAERHWTSKKVDTTRGRRISKMKKYDSKDSLSVVIENMEVRDNSV